jgi:REP element-mobilizing transposase RayT
MSQSLFKVLIHVVFSTKDRADLITPDIEDDLFAYIQGIVENNKSKLILINGTTNHVHLLISLGKLFDVSELIGDIKRSSSKWIKPKGSPNFYWQRGYGVFSIGQSQVPAVTKYIANQKEHHRKISFEDEYREFLNRYEIEYDERYVWD